MILDWGCGNAKMPGAVGMDNAPLPGVDVVHDLRKPPYPFESESAGAIYLNHVFEHFNLEDGQRILREAHRVLSKRGKLYVRVPHVYTVAAWADPTHRNAFTFISGTFFDGRSPSAYYTELECQWSLLQTTARVTCFNWKYYRLRQVDALLSGLLAGILNRLLRLRGWPGAADLLVGSLPMFFVEIRWDFEKTTNGDLQ